MSPSSVSRRQFLTGTGVLAGIGLVGASLDLPCFGLDLLASAAPQSPEQTGADYTLHIKNSAIEIAPKRIISATTYNGQFPGPLLRFKEGRQTMVDVHNDTDTPEQLHWHGQKVSVDVDGAAEEGTPFIPARGKRRIEFPPNPSGFRLYHALLIGLVARLAAIPLLLDICWRCIRPRSSNLQKTTFEAHYTKRGRM